MADTVEIRITGAVDASLPGATNAATAQLNSVAASAQRLGGSASVGAKQFSDALKAVDGDIRKITPDMLGVGTAATEGIGAAVAVEKTAENATKGLNFATSGAVQEYIRLGHEALTGNFSRMPGSLIVLTSRMGGLTGETFAMIGAMGALGLAVAAPIAAIGYLAYRQYEAEKHAEALAESFALAGHGATETAAAVQGETEALERQTGVTSDIAKGILTWEAAHGEIDQRINTFVNQLAPQFAQAGEGSAKTVVQAMGVLKETLNTIVTGDVQQAIGAFDKLDKTNLHLSTSTDQSKRALADQILQLIESGHRIDAMLLALQALATQGGGHFQSIGRQIDDTKTKLEEAKHRVELLTAAAASPQKPEAIDIITRATAAAEQEVENLIGVLHDLEGQAAQPKVNIAISSEDVAQKVRAIQQELNLTDTQQLQKIVGYLEGVKNAEVNSAETRRSIALSLAQYKTELARKSGQDEIDATRETALNSGAVGEALTRQEIAADEQELQSTHVTAQQKLEIRKDLARKNAELSREEAADAKRASREVVAAQKIDAEDAINSTRNAAQEVLSNDRLNAAERGALARQLWDLLLNGDRQTASERAATARDLADRIAREEGLSAAQTVQLEKQIAGILVNSARLTAQERAQSVRNELNDETRARELGRREAEQIDKEAAREAVQAAKDEFELKSTLLDREVDYFQITQTEKIAALKVAIQAEGDAEKAGYQKLLDQLTATGQTETALYQQTKDKILEIDRQTNLRLEQQTTQAAQATVQAWRSSLSPIESGFNSMIGSMLQGNQTLLQSTRQVLLQVVASYLAARLKIEFDWLAGQLAMALGAQQWAQKSVLAWVASLLGINTAQQASEVKQVATVEAGEAAKTGAVAAGAAAQTSIHIAAAGVSNAAEAAADSTSIVNSAYTAGASAFKWVMQEVPFPLNVALAPIAAAAAFTGVMAFSVIKSAEGGEYMVGSSAGGAVPYLLHARESVMPAGIADPMRDFFQDQSIREFIGRGADRFDGSLAGGLAASSGSAGGGDTHIHFPGMQAHFHTPGPNAMKAWIGSNEGRQEMKRFFTAAARGGFKPKTG